MSPLRISPRFGAGLSLLTAAILFSGLSGLQGETRLGTHFPLNGSVIEARGLGRGSLEGFGPSPFVDGKMGPGALHFNSPGQYVALPSYFSSNRLNSFSASVWVKTDSASEQVILSFDRDRFWSVGVGRHGAGPGQLDFGVRTNDGIKNLVSNTVINDGDWHHVVAVFDGSQEILQLYVDGSLDSDLMVPGANRYGSSGRRFGMVGIESNAGSQGGAIESSEWFSGDVDDVRLYSGAVSAAEVTAVFNEDPSDAADALRTPADRDGDGIFNRWETRFGLDPDDPSDGMAPTSDAEGVNNGVTYLDQFRAGADPTVDNDYMAPAETPVISVAVVDADAFELEGDTATFRISAPNATGGPVTVFFSLGTGTDPGEGQSDSSDYEVKDSGGTAVDGFALVPAGGSFDIVVDPILDSVAEFPEVVTLTIDPHSDYVAGINSSASCTISDATDTVENETTFKAIYVPELGASTSATGFATLTINGPKTEAVFYSTYSGLTSAQSTAHIHHVAESQAGVPDLNARGPVVEQLDMTGPHDNVANAEHLWAIRDAAGFSVTQLIDSLFRQNGLSLYCNVHTGTYPAGEIWGFFEEFEGAVAVTNEESTAYESPAPVEPAEDDEGLKRDISRFLSQATWGPRMSDIDDLYNEITTNPAYDLGDGKYDQLAAYNQWITDQLALDKTRLEDLVWHLDEYEFYGHRQLGKSDNEGTPRRLNPVQGGEPLSSNFEGSMWTLFCYSHDQLRQRVALAFSEIWVISRLDGEVDTRHYGAANYWDKMGEFADGNFRDLLEFVSKSPMMGRYLSHLKNETIRDVNDNIVIFPDENYAREIQQLFSIGLLQLLPDGRVRLGGDGKPVQTYSNYDIENLARVFTGWTFSEYVQNSGNIVNNTNFNLGNGSRYLSQVRWKSPMTNFASRHDSFPKTVYAGTPQQTDFPANDTGQQDLDRLLDTLESHPNTAPFLCELLIKRFTKSNPSQGYVYRVASVFEGGSNFQAGSGLVSGGGQVGNFESVIRAILLDAEARDLSSATTRSDAGKSKEPALVVTHAIRAMNAQSRIPLEVLSRLDSGPNYTVNPGSGNTIVLPVTGEDGNWPATDYPADQYDNFPSDASIIHFTAKAPSFGQSPMSAPTVFNFFLPDFIPGGLLASAGLSAPELQLATETQVVDAINFTQNLVEAPGYIDVTNLEGFAGQDDWVRADFTEYLDVYNNADGTVVEKAEALVDYLDLVFAAGVLKAEYENNPDPNNPRAAVIKAILTTNESNLDKVKNAIYLVLHSPAGLSLR